MVLLNYTATIFGSDMVFVAEKINLITLYIGRVEINERLLGLLYCLMFHYIDVGKSLVGKRRSTHKEDRFSLCRSLGYALHQVFIESISSTFAVIHFGAEFFFKFLEGFQPNHFLIFCKCLCHINEYGAVVETTLRLLNILGVLVIGIYKENAVAAVGVISQLHTVLIQGILKQTEEAVVVYVNDALMLF